MDFQNKVIVITGAASGIGQVTAQAFAKEGGTVVVADINEKGGQKTVEQIKEIGGKSIFVRTNVTDYQEVEKLMAQTIDEFGRIDIAINNAGILSELTRTADTSLESWHRVMKVNADGVFYCMKAEIPHMLKQEGGIIVNTASIAGLRGLPNNVAYTASKHAVIGMTKTAAMEYAKKNIRINAICPVFTVTPLFNPDIINQVSEGLVEKLKKGIPMKRFADPIEVANTILWLCSDKATFITGMAMPVDGGLTA